ncbi:hypothetical protein FHL15_005901 [Xylaria flabelliformis]|uniref:Uncharacterized protein n=1 Tax=Xylaria flabelliformis TaxID=2512241 RepID=A0A553HZE7_9PEZI|nr:hypothetical protein FHL15_005901 [Xylaria flabelliformis]
MSAADLKKHRTDKGENRKGGNMGRKRPCTENTGRGDVLFEFNGFEQDDKGESRLRSPIDYLWESESESEGSDRGKPMQKDMEFNSGLAEDEDGDGDGDSDSDSDGDEDNNEN